ncbi:MAG TPA: protein translocase subunit SecD [Solirubrobacteraceae bacterium]|jgi:SecD/SecF fusion protein|nr:protein translocase subunit SecD [Solirubrobacteraceae bacterium]
MTDRRRNTLILLIVVGLIAASVAVIATKKTRLGLDLKGGVQLVYQARPTAQSKVDSESLNQSINIMRKRVDQLGVSQPEIQRSGSDEIDVALPEVKDAKRAEQEVGKTAQLFFYDWEPNVIGPTGKPAPTEAIVTGGPTPASAERGLPEYEAVQRAGKRTAELRQNDTTWTKGCTPAQIGECIYGTWYLLDTKHEKVLRGPEETEKNLYADGYKAPLGAKPQVVRVNPGTVLVQAQPIQTSSGKVTQKSPNSYYVLKDDPVLTGGDVKNPTQSFDESAGGTGAPNVTFEFTGHGKSVFQRVTKEIAHRGQEAQLPGVPREAALQHFAVALDGQIITAPSIDYTKYPEGIDASTGSQIAGGFTITSAQELAQELQSGALPIKLQLISNSQVSATLGKTALNQGLLAGLVGFAIVCLFLLLFYRVLGAIAIGGLVIYGIYFFALIKLIPITLTLPGIAGLILTIGVAADANIVIFERVKEEIRGGRSVISGIATGYKRGFEAIVDANVVTFMTAFILFALATAEVKGFAFTLGIGTLVSLFTAVLATQAALGAMGRSKFVSHPAALGTARRGGGWTFDFMGASKWFFSLSGTILLIGAIAIGGKGLNFGIDFKSGTRIQTAFVRPVSVSEVAKEMTAVGYGNTEVQKYNNKSIGGGGYQISTKTLKPENVQRIKSDLDAKFGHGAVAGTKNFSSTSIGPTFGKTVANSAVIAIIASLLVISAYIALRFSWKYSVPVLIALMHDLLITAGVYSLTGREVTTATVAALLTILGYSLYDTIIVFDRVRENVPRMPRAAFSQIVNRSMSEVLTRSLATSFCTLLPVVSLLLFGGETLKDFAFALMVGIASGAYSSIFIASPVLTHWKEREPGYRNRRARIERELGAVPAYATSAGGEPIDVEPAGKRKRSRRGGLIAPEEPGEQISRDEFQELVRDLDVESPPSAPPARTQRSNGRSRRSAGAGVVQKPPPAKPEQELERPEAPASPRDPTADLTPEDLVLKDDKPAPKRKRARNRRHGRR